MQDYAASAPVTCSECDAEVADGQAVRLRARDTTGQHLVVCAGCAEDIDRTFEAETANPDLVHGLLLGLIAGLACAIVWFWVISTTGWQLGLIAVGLGYVVGKAVLRGTGDKRGRRVQLVAVAATLVVMLFSQYLIGRHFVMVALIEQGHEALPVLLSPLTMVAIVVATLLDLPTLALWGMALVVAFGMTGRRKLERAR